MRRVEIPMHRRTKIADILRSGGIPMHRDILDPVVVQLDGAIVEDNHAILILTPEECDQAAYHVATYGDMDSKLCLLFSEAVDVEAAVPKWGP